MRPLAPKLIDTNYCGHRNLSGIYLIKSISGVSALVDTGSTKRFPLILSEISKLGIKNNDLKAVFLTHCHLDHSGNVFNFARMFPDVKIYCNLITSKRLIDTRYLENRMRRALGARYDIEFKGFSATPKDRIIIVNHNDEISIASDIKMKVIDTRGHSDDHISFFDPLRSIIYCGDALGTRHLVINPKQCVASLPPNHSYYHFKQTIDRIRSIRPSKIALGHYGFVSDIEELTKQSLDTATRLYDIGMRGSNIEEEVNRMYADLFGTYFKNSHRLRGHYRDNISGLKWFVANGKKYSF